MVLQTEKRPRNYAQEILLIDSLEKRRKALDQVPPEWQDWVRLYLQQWWPRREQYRRELQNTHKT